MFGFHHTHADLMGSILKRGYDLVRTMEGPFVGHLHLFLEAEFFMLSEDIKRSKYVHFVNSSGNGRKKIPNAY